ncbi:LTA synthase family protein [Paratractidigestivibacter sp.]|uniref:LTA synthase family protein n=1 Tax=Paratractidigestivibacter sp. TaxID=2847316 RepID=UPI002AC978A5|nr:LTA synthase family protein [Paratractidigestivibacter sp.]
MDITTICSVCLACTCLVAVLDVLRAVAAEHDFHVIDLLWALAPVAAQVFVFAWCKQGLLEWGDGSELMVSVVGLGAACMLMAHLALSRRRFARCMRGISGEGESAAYRAASLPVDLIMVFAAAVFAVLALELPHNHDLAQVNPLTLFIEWALVAAVAVALYFIGQRRGFLAALVPLTCTGFGNAEYFVFMFKSQPLQPGDLFAVSTAATVADGYTYVLSSHCLWALASCVVSMTLLCLVSHSKLSVAGQSCPSPAAAAAGPAATPPLTLRPLGVLANLAVGLALIAAVASNVTGVDYAEEYGITVSAWYTADSYTQQAYLPTFISAFQGMIPYAPEGYDPAAAKGLLAQYAASYEEDLGLGASESRAAAAAQFDAEKPCVVAVMNETFSDLSIFDWMDENYQGPTYFKSIADCLQRGVLYVPVNGGGTTNTEFEFLTGNSTANLGVGVYPYNTYNMGRTDNLARLFKGLGYDTLAMHPYNRQNWNRENVYEIFGFDEFLSLSDFSESEEYRGHVSDAATYDKILDLLNTDSDPQFIFDVTMQNHSGYDTGLIPEDELINYTLADGTDDPLIDEYAASVAKSDQALADFLEALSKLDRKVVVVFFGDHQPYMTVEHNSRFATDEESNEHQQRIYQTNYIIWANYDVAGNEQVSEVVDLDSSALGSSFMELIGAPLSDFQKARLCLREALPAIDIAGYRDALGGWHFPSDDSGVSGTEQARSDLATLQYLNLFGDGKDVYATKLQDKANE